MSNRLFQGVVHQMRDTIDRVIGVIDETAAIIACSDLSKIAPTVTIMRQTLVIPMMCLFGMAILISPSDRISRRIMRSLWRVPMKWRPVMPRFWQFPCPASNSITTKIRPEQFH